MAKKKRAKPTASPKKDKNHMTIHVDLAHHKMNNEELEEFMKFKKKGGAHKNKKKYNRKKEKKVKWEE